MLQHRWLTLSCNDSFKESLWHSEQRPIGVKRIDGWRWLQQLCIGINIWQLKDTRVTIISKICFVILVFINKYTTLVAKLAWTPLRNCVFHTVSFSGSKVSLSASASSFRPCVAAVKYAKDSENTDRPCEVLCTHDYYEKNNALTLSTVLQDADPLNDISQIKCCLVLATHVLPDLSYNFQMALILLH